MNWFSEEMMVSVPFCMTSWYRCIPYRKFWCVSHVIHMWFTCEVPITHVNLKTHVFPMWHILHMWNFTCEISHVKFHMWNFTCEISHVNFTCEILIWHVFHMWNFTCEISHVKFHMWHISTREIPIVKFHMWYVIKLWNFTCESSYVTFHVWFLHVKYCIWNFIGGKLHV